MLIFCAYTYIHIFGDTLWDSITVLVLHGASLINSRLSVEAARVYRFPVFEKSFCEELVEELQHFEESSAPKGRPNTMNHYGVMSPAPTG